MDMEIIQFLRGRKKANLAMVVVNTAVFIWLSMLGDTLNGQFMLEHGACWTPLVAKGEYWRLFTSMFLHFGLSHLVYNMLCLIYLGDVLETAAGPVCYLVIYLLGGAAGNVVSVLWDLRLGAYAVSAGASGAIFAVIGACCYIALRQGGHIGMVPANRIALMAVLMLWQGFTDAGTDNAAHVGGVAAGFLLAVVLYHKKRK